MKHKNQKNIKKSKIFHFKKKMPSLNNNDIIMHIKHIKHDIMDMESVRDNNERWNKEKLLSRNRWNY